MPVLEDPTRKWKKGALSQFIRNPKAPVPTMGCSIKTDRYRYTEWQDMETGAVKYTELYDHQNDPQENESVAGKGEYKEEIKELSELLNGGWTACLPEGVDPL